MFNCGFNQFVNEIPQPPTRTDNVVLGARLAHFEGFLPIKSPAIRVKMKIDIPAEQKTFYRNITEKHGSALELTRKKLPTLS